MAKLKTTQKTIIELQDWDDFVREIYKKPYSFQQQDGCKSRGIHEFEVPSDSYTEDGMNEVIPEVVNGKEMGVKFDVWLARDPKQPLNNPLDQDASDEWNIKLFWARNFYPSFDTLVDDLHEKGLLKEGSYIINIDW